MNDPHPFKQERAESPNTARSNGVRASTTISAIEFPNARGCTASLIADAARAVVRDKRQAVARTACEDACGFAILARYGRPESGPQLLGPFAAVVELNRIMLNPAIATMRFAANMFRTRSPLDVWRCQLQFTHDIFETNVEFARSLSDIGSRLRVPGSTSSGARADPSRR